MKRFNVYGIGHALTDILIEVSTQELAELGFASGSRTLVTDAEQQALLTRFKDRPARLISGGSLANSMIALAQLGGAAAFGCCIGDDRYGQHYAAEMTELGIELKASVVSGSQTGTSLILIDQNGERTMRTNLAAARALGDRHIDDTVAAHSDVVFLEGYVLSNGAAGRTALERLRAIASSSKAVLVFAFSDAFTVREHLQTIKDFLSHTAILFSNTAEALHFSGAKSAGEAFRALCDVVPNVVMTRGADGVLVRYNGATFDIPAVPCRPVDLTGAGDMFAAAFLYGLSNGLAADVAARAACYMAMKVITQIGARLTHEAKQFWLEGLKR